jgi:polyisoprenoid-binding protein YceI
MKSKIILIGLLTVFQLASAQKMICKDGHIWFYSHTPIEDIEAHNRQVVAVLDPSNGELVFTLLVKSFEFKKELMQEHFNENYLESDDFPKAGFKGKIENFDQIDFKVDGKHEVNASGDLTIHGVTKPVSLPGILEIKGGSVQAKSDFSVKPADYDISIPDLVEEQIAKNIEVHVDVVFKQ